MANKENCKAKDCAREAVGKGYCRQHFRLWKAGEMPKARYKICTFEKCRKHRPAPAACATNISKPSTASPQKQRPRLPPKPLRPRLPQPDTAIVRITLALRGQSDFRWLI